MMDRNVIELVVRTVNRNKNRDSILLPDTKDLLVSSDESKGHPKERMQKKYIQDQKCTTLM